MSEFDVDVVIPVHSEARPIMRAVASVTDGTKAAVRVTVVAHNVEPELITRKLGEYAHRDDVRVLSLNDGIHSPAGPMNRGLDAATAPYVSLLGSDDEFAPGAIDSWLRIASSHNASTVLARIDRQNSGPDPHPPTRRGRTVDLDPVKDRLAYRSAPLGLISRKDFGSLRFTPGLGSGEDLEFTATLWFTGSRIAYDRRTPGYLVHEDGGDRVTFATRTVGQDFAFLDAITAAEWFPRLSSAQLQALGVKTLRMHFFDAVLLRLQSPEGISAHRAALDRVITKIEDFAPGSLSLMSRTDRAVIDAIRAEQVAPEHIMSLLSARWGRSPSALLPRNPLLALHRQAPFRTLRATVV